MKMTQTKAIPAAKMRKMPIRFASPRAVRPSPRHPFVMSYKSTKPVDHLTEGSFRLYLSLMFSITPDSCILFRLEY